MVLICFFLKMLLMYVGFVVVEIVVFKLFGDDSDFEYVNNAFKSLFDILGVKCYNM